MTMEQISFSFRTCVFGVLKGLWAKADKNKLDLIYDVDPQIPDQLLGDPLRLRQVLTNLLGNSCKVLSPLQAGRGFLDNVADPLALPSSLLRARSRSASASQRLPGRTASASCSSASPTRVLGSDRTSSMSSLTRSRRPTDRPPANMEARDLGSQSLSD